MSQETHIITFTATPNAIPSDTGAGWYPVVTTQMGDNPKETFIYHLFCKTKEEAVSIAHDAATHETNKFRDTFEAFKLQWEQANAR